MSNMSSCQIDDSQWSLLGFSHQQELCTQFKSCESDGFIPWSELYFCAGATSIVLQIFMLVLCLFATYLLFKLLGSTADFLFAPTLAELSDQMKLPQRFAGVTFLAIGNGAPDISATVAAITQGNYELSFGALTGAGMFVTAFVAGNIISGQPEGRVRAQGATLRDISFLLFTVGFWALVLEVGTVGIGAVVFSLAVFAIFLLLVGFSDFWHHVLDRPLPKSLASMRLFSYDRGEGEVERGEDEDDGSSVIMRPLISREEVESPQHHQDPQTTDENELAARHREYRQQRQAKGRRGLEMLANDDADNDEFDYEGGYDDTYTDPYGPEQEMQINVPPLPDMGDYYNDTEAIDGETGGVIIEEGEQIMPPMEQLQLESTQIVKYDKWWWWQLREMVETIAEENYMEISQQNLFVKVHMAAVFPVVFFQRLTVPVITQENYQPEWLQISLVFTFAFLAFWNPIGQSFPWWTYPALILLGLIISLPLYFLLFKNTKEPPLKTIFHYAVWIFISLIGFTAAIGWIDILANELVAIFTLGGQILGWPQALMGSTLLALGNSIGDYNTNHSMARGGKVSMAITACFAGPLFNMLIGLSLGFMLFIFQEEGSVDVSLPHTGLIGVLFLLLNMGMVVLASLFNKYKIPKNFGYVMMVMYVIYCMVQFPVAFLWQEKNEYVVE